MTVEECHYNNINHSAKVVLIFIFLVSCKRVIHTCPLQYQTWVDNVFVNIELVGKWWRNWHLNIHWGWFFSQEQ